MSRPARLMQREAAYARLPSITYAAEAETARTAQTLSQAMDRITSFATKQAAVEAEIKGTEYGAQKAPTKQQLREAIEQGQDPDDLIPGDTFTIFGQAARKQALATLANTMEIDARQSITKLQMAAEQTNMSSEDLIYQMNELLDGYQSTLVGVSPSLAKKFRASMATVGNSIVSAHAKKLLADQEAKDKVAALAAMDDVVTNIPNIVAEPVKIVNDFEIVTAEEILASERELIIQYGYTVGDKSLVKEKLKEFDDAVSAAKIGRLVDFVSKNPLANRSAVSTGKKPGNVKQEDFDSLMQTYASLTDEERRDYRKQSREAFNQYLDDEQKKDSFNTLRNSEKISALKLQIFDARISTDPESEQKLKDALTELRLIDEDEAIAIEESIFTTGGVDNAETVEHLTFKQLDGILTSTDLLDARRSRQISVATLKQFVTALATQRGTAFTSAIKYAKDIAGYPPPSLIHYDKKQIRARRRVASIEADLIEEMVRNPGVNHLEFVRQKLKETERDTGPTEADVSRATQKLLDQRPNLGLDQSATVNDVIIKLIDKGQDDQYRDLIDLVEGN